LLFFPCSIEFIYEMQEKEAKDLLDSIFFGAELPIFVIDVEKNRELRFASLNPAHEKLTGFTSSWIKGRSPEDLYPRIPKEFIKEIRGHYEECLNKEQTIQYEEMIPFDGKEIWWLTTLTPLKDESGEVFRIIGTSVNISQQKVNFNTVEKLLVERSEQLEFQIIEIELVHDIYEILDGNFDEIPTILQAVCNAIYASFSPLLSISCRITYNGSIIQSGEDPDPKSSYFKESILGTEQAAMVWYLEKGFSSIKSIPRLLQVICSILSNELEKRGVKDQLSQSEIRYRSLFERMTEGYALAAIIQDEAEKVIDFTFLDVNSAFEGLTGFNRDTILGKNVSSFFPETEEKWETILSIFSNVALKGEEQSFEHFSQEKETWYTVYCFQPQFKQFAVTLIDITEQKISEQKREALLEDLTRSNQDLEQFAYVASHDLQEPLRKIQAFGERLATMDSKDEKSGHYLELMIKASSRARALIDDLLAYSRLSTTQSEEKCVSLQAVCEDLERFYTKDLEESEGTLEYEALPDILGIPVQIHQVFQNLISNSIKFRSEKPLRIKISCETEDSWYLIRFQDNGIGFEPELSEKIFIIFQRLHSKTAYPGTGIGLALCKKIIERHGGSITANSALGEGTEFVLRLPVGRKNWCEDDNP
jgi:PAS domain S-box-containing protein